jgi:hypothetical protein
MNKTNLIVRMACEIAAKEVRLPKIVRDGIVKKQSK